MRSHRKEAARPVVRVFQPFLALCANPHNKSEPLPERWLGLRSFFRGGLTVIGLLCVSIPAQAEYKYMIGGDSTFQPTPDAACQYIADQYIDNKCPYGGCYPVRLVSENVIEPPVPYRDSVIYYCSITIELLNYPPVYGSPLRTYTHQWMVRVGTPDICEAGQTADPKTGKCPVVECPVGALTPYSPDPYPLDIENLTDRAKKAVGCLEECSGQSRTAFLSSAYRPVAYQNHIREVWNKWKNELEFNTLPACEALRTQVQDEFTLHQLGGSTIPPSNNSCHTTTQTSSGPQSIGSCFDVNSWFIETVDLCSTQCTVYRPWPSLPPPRRSDPVHVLPY